MYLFSIHPLNQLFNYFTIHIIISPHFCSSGVSVPVPRLRLQRAARPDLPSSPDRRAHRGRLLGDRRGGRGLLQSLPRPGGCQEAVADLQQGVGGELVHGEGADDAQGRDQLDYGEDRQ